MDIEIRKANQLDYKDIANIDVKTSIETYKGIMPNNYLYGRLENIENIENKVKERLENNFNYIVLLVDDNIVGYSLYLKSNDIIYLDSLYLLKEYHGIGLGKKLFLSTISDIVSKSYNSMYLYCAKDNKSCNFYEIMGAKKVDEIDYSFNNFVVKSIIYEFDNLNNILEKNNVKVLNLK